MSDKDGGDNMIQKERLEALIRYAKNDNLPIVGNEGDAEQLLKELEGDELQLVYSNDDEIEMIIDKVREYTDDEKIKNYLCSVNIFNDINMKNMNAFAYYSDDDLHRVVASNEMLRKLERLSGIASTIFLIDYYPQPDLCDVIIQYLVSLVYAYDSGDNEDYESSYLYAQYLMMQADKKYEHFTDYLVYFGREIYEGALAFIIGHEIGHHYLGHIEELVRQNGNVSDSEIKRNEYSADEFGTFFVFQYVAACLSEENCFGFISEDVFRRCDYRLFGMLVLINMLGWMNENAESSTHPSAQTRVSCCIDVMRNHGISEKMISALEDMVACLSKTIEDIREIMRRAALSNLNAIKPDVR